MNPLTYIKTPTSSCFDTFYCIFDINESSHLYRNIYILWFSYVSLYFDINESSHLYRNIYILFGYVLLYFYIFMSTYSFGYILLQFDISESSHLYRDVCIFLFGYLYCISVYVNLFIYTKYLHVLILGTVVWYFAVSESSHLHRNICFSIASAGIPYQLFHFQVT